MSNAECRLFEGSAPKSLPTLQKFRILSHGCQDVTPSLSESCFGKKHLPIASSPSQCTGPGSWNFCSQQGPMSKSQELQPQILTDPSLCLKIRGPAKKKVETVHLHINKTRFCQQNDSKTEWDLGQKMRHVFLVFWAILLSCDMT